MSTAALDARTQDEADALDIRGVNFLASLKFTCILLVISMFLVLAGSLAQARRDVWDVVQEYFRTWVAMVQVKDLFPPGMFPGLIDFNWDTLGPLKQIPWPGGWTIGFLMWVNLALAHIKRIRVRANGGKMVAGLVAMGGAVLLNIALVSYGNFQSAERETLSYSWVWGLILVSISGISLGSLVLTFGPFAGRKASRVVWGTVAFTAGAVAIYFIVGGEAVKLRNESMRILWQLLQGSVAATALLIPSIMLFDKRGGIVVLHLGVLMLMLSELQVAMTAHEDRISMSEDETGRTAPYAFDIRSVELAIVKHAQPAYDLKEGERAHAGEDEEDQVWVIPQETLEQANSKEAVISRESLPFHLRIPRYLVNCVLESRAGPPSDGKDEINATAGLGVHARAVEINRKDGMQSDVDSGAIYVEIIDPATGETADTHLVANKMSGYLLPRGETVNFDGETYHLYLRFRRTYFPWSIELVETSRTNYLGTSVPKDFRSTFVITEESGEQHTFTTKMNNPVRYAGLTFFQSDHGLQNGVEFTSLQVVRNSGWMLPYIGCMVVAFGMFAQFGQTLIRFLGRQGLEDETLSSTYDNSDDATDSEDSDAPASPLAAARRPLRQKPPKQEKKPSSPMTWIVPMVLVVITAGYVASKARSTPKKGAVDFRAFNRLPVTAGGRVQPIRSLAEATFLPILGKDSFEGEMEARELEQERDDIITVLESGWEQHDWSGLKNVKGDYQVWEAKIRRISGGDAPEILELMRPYMTEERSATWLLLDIVARPELAERHRIFHIVNDEVLALLGLEIRPGLRYSLSEFNTKLRDLIPIQMEAVKLQQQNESARITTKQRKVMELMTNVRTYNRLRFLFNEPAEAQAPGYELFETVEWAWQTLKIAKDESLPALCVPTNAWQAGLRFQSRPGAVAISTLARQLRERNLTTREDLLSAMTADMGEDELKRRLMTQFADSVTQLRAIAKESDPKLSGDELDAQVKVLSIRALAAMPRPSAQHEIMKQIAASWPEKSAAELAAQIKLEDLSTEDRSMIAAASVNRVPDSLDGDPRQKELQRLVRLNLQIPNGYRTAGRLVAELMLDDLEEMAGPMLFTAQETARQKAAQALLEARQNGTSEEEMPDDPDDWLTDEELAVAAREREPGVILSESDQKLAAIFTAWGDQDMDGFVDNSLAYHKWLGAQKIDVLADRVSVGVASIDKLSYESFVNHFQPQMNAIFIYLTALVFGFLSWMVWRQGFQRSAFGLSIVAFVLHSFFLLARMQISGRPPVTNLYSSAVFIGWGVALSCILLEAFLKLGLFNIVGAISGAVSLVIANILGMEDGDTMAVMQAVLDTQFWLATHVVCITFGYAATFLAGFLGIVYVVKGSLRKTHVDEQELLGKVIYGTVCFALFLSFVGTVLGGLWADDSWGRFWGWDPKENGALMIVIWNAIILHARWDKMIRDYGTAVLAVLGNVVTAWSWFGVNELGAGLHNYGFTEGRLRWLAGFMLINVVFVCIAVGMKMLMKSAEDSDSRAAG